MQGDLFGRFLKYNGGWFFNRNIHSILCGQKLATWDSDYYYFYVDNSIGKVDYDLEQQKFTVYALDKAYYKVVSKISSRLWTSDDTYWGMVYIYKIEYVDIIGEEHLTYQIPINGDMKDIDTSYLLDPRFYCEIDTFAHVPNLSFPEHLYSDYIPNYPKESDESWFNGLSIDEKFVFIQMKEYIEEHVSLSQYVGPSKSVLWNYIMPEHYGIALKNQ